jgi:acylphosphatase
VSERRLKVVITGRVQGVWFRGWMTEQADARGLDGWVRNCSDGSVEAVFSGPAILVDEMIAACWRGPPLARVAEIVVEAWPDSVDGGFHHLRGR